MKCSTIQPLLSRLIDSDLNPLQRMLVRRHLSRCQACAEEFERFKAVSLHARKALNSDVDGITVENLWQAIENRLPVEKRKVLLISPQKKVWKKWSPVLVGVVTVVVFSLWLKPEPQDDGLPHPTEQMIAEVPVVEEVFQEGVTVMTFETNDPKIKVVWFFQENEIKENGGVS